MKMKIIHTLIAGALLMMLPSSSYPTYEDEYAPIYMEYADLVNSVSYKPGARTLQAPGKIYCKHPYIYINEKYKGIHIINNTQPEKPVAEGFILAPGCLDIAIKDNIIYMDNAVDLVALDLDTKQVTSRTSHVFPEPQSPGTYTPMQHDKTKVIVEWRKIKK
jgi:hypothetical protein